MPRQKPIIREYWDLAMPAVPTRSHLYHLEPIGVGTPEVECLTSYIARLAEAHNVTPSTLVRMEILPRLDRQYFVRGSLAPFWSARSKSFNGMSPLARDLVQRLHELTCRSELESLTLLKWKNVLAPSNLVRPHRAWCPACYQEWSETGQVIYEPLLWMVKVVTHCPRHRQLLCTRCPHCQQMLPVLGPRMRPGHCSRKLCQGWLGVSPGDVEEKPGDSNEGELKWQNWVATTIGALLAAASDLSIPPATAQFQQAAITYVRELADGEAGVLARKLRPCHLHIKADTIRNWQSGHLPRLSPLLQWCYCLQTSPLQILTGETTAIPSQLRELPSEQPHTPPARKRRSYDPNRLRQALAETLSNQEEPPPSMSEVCRRLEYPHIMLTRAAPELCYAISRRFLLYRRNKKIERQQRIRDEMRRAMLNIHAQGLYPNGPRIKPLLSRPSYYADPEARAIWHEILRELGWEK